MAQTNDDVESDWSDFSPLLDQGLSKLPAADRDALVLRFMEAKTLRQVGEAMGISEEAAQKRVTRAVAKLRDFFQRRGIATMSVAGLAAALTAKSVQAAPNGLVTSVSTIPAGAAQAGSIATLAKGTIVAMSMQKTGAIAGIALLLLLGMGGVGMAIHAMIASPRAHTVTLASEPTSAVPSGSAVTFSDGTSVRILGITEVPSAGTGNLMLGALDAVGISLPRKPRPMETTWWDVNGSAIAPVSLAHMGMVFAGDSPGRRQVRFMFATSGANHDTGSADFVMNNAGSRAQSGSTIGNETWDTLVVSLPADQKQTDIKFGWASGPWHEDQVTPVGEIPNAATDAAAAPRAPSTRPAGLIDYKSIHEENGKTVVEILHDRRKVSGRASMVLVVLTDGKKVYCNESQGLGNGQETLKFPAPQAKVSKIVWSSRPYERQTLSNIALKPRTATTTSVASK